MAGMGVSLMADGDLQFLSILTGAEEVPPVITPGLGAARFIFNPTLTVLRALLTVTRLRRVTVAHIHLGRPGQNGPVVVTLRGANAPPIDIPFPTLLADLTISAPDPTGPLGGQPLSVLAQQMLAGNTYTNVHTVQHPDGEMRGQNGRLPF